MNNELSVAERRAVVADLHRQGMSERAIAEALGVSRTTVYNDLRAAEEPGTNVGDDPVVIVVAKEPQMNVGDDPVVVEIIEECLDEEARTGAKFASLRREVSERAAHRGVKISKSSAAPAIDKVRRVRRERVRAEAETAPIDWDTLPGPMRDRLETMRRQVRRELEAEFESRVVAEVSNRMDYAIRAVERRERDAARVLNARKGVFTAAQYRTIKACLHPDSRDAVSDERLAEVFRLVNEADILLMDEREHPISSSLPSVDELLKRRRRMA